MNLQKVSQRSVCRACGWRVDNANHYMQSNPSAVYQQTMEKFVKGCEELFGIAFEVSEIKGYESFYAFLMAKNLIYRNYEEYMQSVA